MRTKQEIDTVLAKARLASLQFAIKYEHGCLDAGETPRRAHARANRIQEGMDDAAKKAHAAAMQEWREQR